MRKILAIFVLLLSVLLIVACSPSTTVQNNIARDAENFSVYRKATVINLISDNILLEVEGYFSMERSDSGALAIVIKIGPKEYKMHYIYQDATIHVITLVEQLENTSTDPYHWTIRVYAIKPNFEGV